MLQLAKRGEVKTERWWCSVPILKSISLNVPCKVVGYEFSRVVAS
jgi:hypothetical protein